MWQILATGLPGKRHIVCECKLNSFHQQGKAKLDSAAMNYDTWPTAWPCLLLLRLSNCCEEAQQWMFSSCEGVRKRQR